MKAAAPAPAMKAMKAMKKKTAMKAIFRQAVVLAIHHERAAAEGVLPVAILPLACPDLLRLGHLCELLLAAEFLQEVNRLLRLRKGFCPVADHQGQLRNIVDAMAPRHDQRRERARRKGRGHGVPLLCHINAAVPPAPGNVGVEHASAAAHVAEG